MKPCKYKIVSYQENCQKVKEYIKDILNKNQFIYSDKEAELIISLGGDGTFLSSMHDNNFNGSYLSINLGHLGFFSDYQNNEVDKAIDDILNKDMIIEKCKLLKVKYSEEEKNFFADIVLNSIKTVDINLKVNDKHIVTSKANGIVISSPIGSTGYNFSLNSPVCFFSDSIMIYSLIAPVRNKMNQNVIAKGIIKDSDVLTLDCKGDSYFTLDGKMIINRENLSLVISKSDKEVTLCHFKKIDSITRIKKSI